MNCINFIASIVSILSAFFSFVMFLKNKTIRNDIIAKNIISKITAYSNESKSIILDIEKYSAQKGKSLALNFNELIKNLKSFYKLTKSIENSLKNGKINEELKCIQDFIKKFSKTTGNPYKNNLDEINSIYFQVVDIDTKIKNELDSKIYL